MIRNNKGIVLFIVLALSLVVMIIIIGLLYVLGANQRNLEAFQERTRAYYLCETGASIAIVDIGRGNIGTKPGQWLSRTVNFSFGGKSYPINYKVSKEGAMWIIVSEVGRAAGFNRTYKLRVGGRRAFPNFIRGFGGK